jgi:hypothetical protein
MKPTFSLSAANAPDAPSATASMAAAANAIFLMNVSTVDG